jgi:hypothetical protein
MQPISEGDRASVSIRKVNNGFVVYYNYTTEETDKDNRTYKQYHESEFVFTDKNDAFVRAEELLTNTHP